MVCAGGGGGAVRARFQVPNTGKGFAGLCRRLVKLGVAAVAIERPDGPLVEALVEVGLQVVVVTPRQVEGCFPGAIGLFTELHSPTAVAFLRRYLTSHAAAGLTQATLAAFLCRLHYPGRTPVKVLLGRIQTAPESGISLAEAAGQAVWALALLNAIQACAGPGTRAGGGDHPAPGPPRRRPQLHQPAQGLAPAWIRVIWRIWQDGVA